MEKEKVDFKKYLYSDEEYAEVTKKILNTREQAHLVKTTGHTKKYILTNYGRMFELLINTNNETVSVRECVYNIRPMQNPPKPSCNYIIPENSHSSANIDVFYDYSKYINIRKLVYETFNYLKYNGRHCKLDRRTEVLYNINGNPLDNHIDNIETVPIQYINMYVNSSHI